MDLTEYVLTSLAVQFYLCMKVCGKYYIYLVSFLTVELLELVHN